LVGENLVVGEPLARALRARFAVRLGQRRPPRAPAFAAEEARLDPFRKVGRALQRLAREFAHAAVGEALGQRIDRLADGRRGPLPRLAHLGMDDLPLVAISFELARHDALLADRQAALRPAGVVEIDEADGVAVGIRCENSRRPASGAVLASQGGRELEDDVAAKKRGARSGCVHPFDRAGRQVIKHVDDAGQVDPLERPRDLRPDTLQHLDFGEERIEDIRAHGGV
jgi:hypothetical protein